jgi:hypothetical protein
MSKRLHLTVILLSIVAVGSASSAMASFISIGDKLAYDASRNKVWYTSFDLSSDFDQVDTILAGLTNSATINSQQAHLSWSLASVNDIDTIPFLDEPTLDLFTPNNPTAPDVYIFSGITGDVITRPPGYGPDKTTLYVVRGAYRTKSGNLDWYDDYVPGIGGHSTPLDYANGPFWLTADVSFTAVPEPSTALIFGLGLLGLARFKNLLKK